MRHRSPIVFFAVAVFGLWSCSGWCAGCTDTNRVRLFTDGGACFESIERCSFPAPPHPPTVTVIEVNCDGG